MEITAPAVNNLQFTPEQLRAAEKEMKSKTVAWLMKRTGQSANSVVAALKNPKFKNSWLGLYTAVRHADCARMQDFFGCACDGKPENNCPHSHAYYDVTWETDRETGALIGFRLGARLCEKWKAHRESIDAEPAKSDEEMNKKIEGFF